MCAGASHVALSWNQCTSISRTHLEAGATAAAATVVVVMVAAAAAAAAVVVVVMVAAPAAAGVLRATTEIS